MAYNLREIKIHYINKDDFFKKSNKQVLDFIQGHYQQLLAGNTHCWNCDVFHDELKNNIYLYKKHNLIWIHFAIRTNLDREEEKKLFNTSDFRHGFYAIEREILEKFEGIIDAVGMGYSWDFRVYLTPEKSRDILLTKIGDKFEVDKYVLFNDCEIYTRS